MQLVIVASGLFGLKYKWHPKITWKSPDFRVVLRNLPPRSIDQGLDQIQSIVETNFARRLGEGNVSFYYNAYILQTAPIIMIGTAISTAAFPRLTNRLAAGRTDLFRKEFMQILRTMLWITLPISVLAYFCRTYLARLIFARDSGSIALVFGFLCGAILFRTLYTIISRWFYAQKDTRTPLYVSLFSIGLNIVLVWKLSRPEPYGFGIGGLAIAQTIVATFEVFILMSIMVWRDRKLFTPEFWSGVIRTLSVTGFTVITAFIMASLIQHTGGKGFITLISKMLIIVVPSLIVHIGVSALFGLEEVEPVVKKIRAMVLKPVRIQ